MKVQAHAKLEEAVLERTPLHVLVGNYMADALAGAMAERIRVLADVRKATLSTARSLRRSFPGSSPPRAPSWTGWRPRAGTSAANSLRRCPQGARGRPLHGATCCSAWVTSGGRVLLAVRPAPGGQGVETPVRAPVLSPLPSPPPLPPGDDLGLDEAPSSAGEDVLPVLPPAILMRPMSALWMGPAVDASIPAVDDFLLSGAAKTFPTSPSYCR